jgi:hypothetical protein
VPKLKQKSPESGDTRRLASSPKWPASDAQVTWPWVAVRFSIEGPPTVNDSIERPPADSGRESDAVNLFPLEMSPEEYAARHAHGWYCFSFDDYRYRDSARDAWIQRLGEILRRAEGAPTIDELRQIYLTAEETRMIECELEEEERELGTAERELDEKGRRRDERPWWKWW